MDFSSILYPLIIVFCLFLIYTNIKNDRQYKKENIRVLYNLNEDDKTMRLASGILLGIMIISSGSLLYEVILTKSYNSFNISVMAILPVLLIILYGPLSRKTRITTLGIYKRTNLIRWEEIKSVNYLKPDVKGNLKVKIIYRNMSRDMTANIMFKKNDEQFEIFKSTVKEYRSNKKRKDKKIEK